MKDTRKLWLLLENGLPAGFGWGLVQYHSEIEPGMNPQGKEGGDWASALGVGKSLAAGWAAVETTWRRVPVDLRVKSLLDQCTYDPVDRKIVGFGAEFSLDDPGPDRGPDRERGEPDTVITDQVAYDAAHA